MQVSIYLDAALAKKVDQKAKRSRKSRSQFVQSLLRAVLFKRGARTVFDKMFGRWDQGTADELLKTIYESRQNSSRFL